MLPPSQPSTSQMNQESIDRGNGVPSDGQVRPRTAENSPIIPGHAFNGVSGPLVFMSVQASSAAGSSAPSSSVAGQSRPPLSHSVPSQQHNSAFSPLRQPGAGQSPSQTSISWPSQSHSTLATSLPSAAPSATGASSNTAGAASVGHLSARTGQVPRQQGASGQSAPLGDGDLAWLQQAVSPYLAIARQALDQSFGELGIKLLTQEKQSQAEKARLQSRLQQMQKEHETALASILQQHRDQLAQVQGLAHQEIAKGRQENAKGRQMLERLAGEQRATKRQAAEMQASKDKIIQLQEEELRRMAANLKEATKRKEDADTEVMRLKATRAFEKGSSMNPIQIKEEPRTSPFASAHFEKSPPSTGSGPPRPDPLLLHDEVSARATSEEREVTHMFVSPIAESTPHPQTIIADLRFQLDHAAKEIAQGKESRELISTLRTRLDRLKKQTEELKGQLSTLRAEGGQRLERADEEAKQKAEAEPKRMLAETLSNTASSKLTTEMSSRRTPPNASPLEEGELDLAADDAKANKVAQLSVSLHETETKLHTMKEDRDRLSERVLLAEAESRTAQEEAATAKEESAKWKNIFGALQKKVVERKAASANTQSGSAQEQAASSASDPSRPSPCPAPTGGSVASVPVNTPAKVASPSPAVDSSSPLKFLNVTPKPINLRPVHKPKVAFPFRNKPRSINGPILSSAPTSAPRTEATSAVQPTRKRDSSSSLSDEPTLSVNSSSKKPRLDEGPT